MGFAQPGQIRFKLTKFEQIEDGTRASLSGARPGAAAARHRPDLGAPKSRKTFFALDLVLHVALAREYCGKRVQ